MDAHLFRLFARALTPMLMGARVEKIQEPFPDVLTISFYGAGKKRQLCIRFGRKEPFCFLTEARIGAGVQPSAPIMRIRRYFGQKRIAATVCQFCARRLWLLAAGGDSPAGKAAWLCLDLAKGPCLHFLDASQAPESEQPEWPEAARLAEALNNWRAWPPLTPALRKTMLLLEQREQWALLEDLRAGSGYVFLYSGAGADGVIKIRKASAWPLPPPLRANLTEMESGDVLASLEKAGQDLVLARLFNERAEKLLSPIKKRTRHIQKLLGKLEAEEKRLLAMRQRESDAIALAANLWRLDGQAHVDSITVAGEHGEPKEIALDRRLSVIENMERFFHGCKRGKRGLAMLEERRKSLLNELAELSQDMAAPCAAALPHAAQDPDAAEAGFREADNTAMNNARNQARAMQKTLPANARLFISTDGYLILRGKDAKGNHALRRFAAPHDLWAHVEKGPGAHVIIRRPNPGHEIPDRTLEEAGALAANKSWLCEADMAPVMFAEMRHVKPARGGPKGMMLVDRIYTTRNVPVNHELEERLSP